MIILVAIFGLLIFNESCSRRGRDTILVMYHRAGQEVG